MNKMTYILADGLADLSAVVIPADAQVQVDHTAAVSADLSTVVMADQSAVKLSAELS
jgi:hypothetical protein